MIVRKTYTVTYESESERIREQVTTHLLLGFIPLYTRHDQLWRKAGAVDDDTRALVFALDDWQCVYCGASDEAVLTIDHRIPQNQGGTSYITNLLTACRSCNSAKSDQTPEEAQLSLAFGRFSELPIEVDDRLLYMICLKWVYAMDTPCGPIYCSCGTAAALRDPRKRGLVRRIVVDNKPVYVLRRCAWGELCQSVDMIEQAYEDDYRQRLRDGLVLDWRSN